jgi:hypothetical protein
LTGDLSHQLAQLKDYLFYLVDELQFNEGSIKAAISGGSTGGTNITRIVSTGGSSSPAPTPDEIFNNIKAQIIKVADVVVAAESKKLTESFTSQYEAISNEFGTYKEEVTNTITLSTEGINQKFTEIEAITSDAFEAVNMASDYVKKTDAYIKSGILDGGVYGIEIGQTDTYNETSTFKAFARFTAQKLSFFDGNGSEVAYISQNKLYINNVVINHSLTVGLLETKVKVKSEDDVDVIERWI